MCSVLDPRGPQRASALVTPPVTCWVTNPLLVASLLHLTASPTTCVPWNTSYINYWHGHPCLSICCWGHPKPTPGKTGKDWRVTDTIPAHLTPKSTLFPLHRFSSVRILVIDFHVFLYIEAE